MSDFGLFEAATDAEQAPRRRERIAARHMSAALQQIHAQFGGFITQADAPDTFEDRWLLSKKDILRVLQANQVGAYPAVVREVHGSLKSAWLAKHASDDCFDEEAGDSEDSDFSPGGDTGSDKPSGKESRRRQADFADHEEQSHPNQDLQQGREVSDGLLIPDAYNDPSNPETSGVQNDFSPGGDTGKDAPHREAMQLVADLYTDWAQGNNLRVASMNTLDVYAANGLHDDDYYLLASLIRRAECDCDDDKKDEGDGGDSGGESSSDDSGDSSSDDGGDDSGSDDGGGDSDESGSDDSSGENPFAGGDDSDDSGEPADDGGNPFAGGDDSAPDDSGEAPGDDVPPADDGGAPEDVGDPATDPSAAGPPDVGGDVPPDAGGPPEAAGQEFTVPETPPELPPEAMSQIPPDDTQGDQAVPPEVIDQILGLPPGTLEQLIMEELQGGGGAPPSGPAPGGPPPQLAFRRRAAEDPTEAAGADPAAAAQPQMPAAPPAGAGSAGTLPPPGSASVAPPPPAMPLENQPAEDALLDTAVQSVTQMIDQETQEYQQIIDPLTQALQAIEFAQQVETAENPLDVTPPEGSVDVDPSAAPGGADSLENKAAKIAHRYKLSRKGYNMLLEAMSRKHYEHVGEAIRTLPPELRPGIANHIGAMFREDNPRFNNDKWLASVGAAPITASRRPFVIRSRRANGGRTAGENLKNTPTLDAFEFPGQGDQKSAPRIDDNHAVTDLPKLKGASYREAKDVLKKWDDYTKVQTDKGLNVGGDAEIDQFANEKQIGPKAIQKLKTTIGYNRKSASFFTRRVPGWTWDDHLAGYVSKEARAFTCSCGESIPTPSFGTCRCGKIWNSYAIGDGNHLAANSADMFIVREIPVRDDVIVANRQMASFPGMEDHEIPGYLEHLRGKLHSENISMSELSDLQSLGEAGHIHPQDAELMEAAGIPEEEYHRQNSWNPESDPFDPRQFGARKQANDDRGYEMFDAHSPNDTEWVEDEDREHADAPHAPGKSARANLAWDAAKVAGSNMIGEQVGHVSDPNFSGIVRGVNPMQGTAWVSHPGGIHEMSIYDLTSSEGTGPAGPSLKQRVRQHLMDRASRGGPAGGFAGGRSASQEFFAEKVTDESDGWIKYDDEDPSRQGGPKKPPSTKLQGGDPHWHKRQDGGKFKSTNPFGG